VAQAAKLRHEGPEATSAYGNLTTVVRQLEPRKLLVTRADPEDRRYVIVALTEEGKRQFEEIAAAHHEWIRTMMKDFSLTKPRHLYQLLADLKASFGPVRP
jgi:DNA-binding MarR family transcriptional regulator